MCVLLTVLDLLSNGYSVHVVADGVSSRSTTDRMFALERMRQMGAVVATHETVLFQLMNDKNHDKFKEISKLVKDKITFA